MEFPGNIQDQIKKRIKELSSSEFPTDKKELAERQDAAGRYAGENATHFVDFAYDCIKTSVNALKNIREVQKECLRVYNEDPPPNYAKKERWQSKTVIPKPFETVVFAMSAVRKSFTPDFLSIEKEKDKVVADFWTRLMKHHLDRSHSNFPVNFTDATGMAFAIGQSMEMIPVWRQGQGLQYVLVEPWKIHRDPDALPRKPHSGMYWIHQEYVDYYLLREAQKRGRYINIEKVENFNSETSSENPDVSKFEINQRKEMLWSRSTYRKYSLTSEFWGTVLGPKGDLLLPNATYTISGNQLISPPKQSPFRTMRWPGISFSPIPNFLRYDGRGLLQGVRSLWYMINSLITLHNDYLNWVVNPMTEINVQSLVDQDDLDIIPGKPWLVKETLNGQPVVRTIERGKTTNEILPNLQYADQNFQRGTFVTDAVQGLPGWRQEVTKGEALQNLDQAMGPFALMGSNVEDGAILAVRAGAETIEANAGYDDLLEEFTPEQIQEYVDPSSPTGLRLPELNGSFHISGLASVLKDAEVMKTIIQIIMPMLEKIPDSKPYISLSGLFRAIEVRSNLRDEGIFVDPETGKRLDEVLRQAHVEKIGEEDRLARMDAATKAQAVEAQKIQAEASMVAAQKPTAPGGNK